MSFVWDERKERKNIRKHKVSFDEAITTFDDPFFVIAADDYHSLEENGLLFSENRMPEDCSWWPTQTEEKIQE